MNSIQNFLVKKELTKPIEFNKTYLAKEELEAVLDCLLEDRITTETITEKFEKLFSETLNFKYAIAVNSKTSAYHLAFSTLARKNSTVWLMNLSSINALDAARYLGLSIQLIEIDKNSFFPSKDFLNELILKEMQEGDIFVADYIYGAYYSFPFELLEEKKVHVIEDITGILGYQIGMEENSSISIGTYSQIQICGLYEDDIITTGKGALLLTHSKPLHKEIEETCYGKHRNLTKIAYDYVLADFQSAMGIHQLNKIGSLVSRRKKIGQKYVETIKNTDHETYFNHLLLDNYHRFPVVFDKNQEEIIRYFRSLKIEVQKIPLPLHKYLGHASSEFPNSERLYKKSLCMPIYPILTSSNVERIASSIRNIL
ncbi:MAG: DegT/DnrJ/EryC1/StrS family aminotransferase [Leptonema sp. (in: bacteria)]